MGTEGNQQTGQIQLSAALFCERLSPFAGIKSKEMFAGFGILHEGKMFALVNSTGEVYLKSNESIHSKLDKIGADAHGKMAYFSVPNGIRSDPDALITWTPESIDISSK